MASILKVDTIQDQSGNNIINESGDTITIGASGDTINIVGTLQNNGNNAVGITMADQWRLTTSTNSGTNADITTNWERNDSTGYGSIGTGMTESSGIFTFPSTGIYFITEFWTVDVVSGSAVNMQGLVTIDNSSYSTVTTSTAQAKGGDQGMTLANQFLIDVTDTSNVKIKFATASFIAGDVVLGSSTQNRSSVSFIRLGDT
jgi:hypothetical protein